VAKYVKVPVVLQMETFECGAASLEMILAYYHRWIPLDRLREECDVTQDGANARNIVQAARKYGLNARGYSLSVEQLRDVAPPCIIHWEFNHFVVLCGFDGDRAVINDPAKGSRTVPADEFDRAFTGICLTFEKTDEFEPGGRKPGIAGFLRGKWSFIKKPILFLLITGIVSAAVMSILPRFRQLFLDSILTERSGSSLLPPTIGAMIALAAILLAVSVTESFYKTSAQARLAACSSCGFFWHVLHLPMRFFAARGTGEIVFRQDYNEQASTILIDTIVSLSVSALVVLVYLVIMLRESIWLSIPVLGGLALYTGLSLFISGKRKDAAQVKMRDEGKLHGMAANIISVIDTVKATGSENALFEKWAGVFASYQTSGTAYSRIDELLMPMSEFFLDLTNAAVLALGAYLTIKGRFSAGMLLAFQGYVQLFFSPAVGMIHDGKGISEMQAENSRIDDVMEYDEDARCPDEAESYEKLQGNITLSHVTFGYSRLSPPLISDFSLSVEKGQSIAIVGASGSGKSTIAKLITGLYEPWSGDIFFDGKRISEIPRSIFSGSVASVDQDITLFEGTLSENIKLWDDTIEDFEVILAARDADLHSDITKRALGYESVVTENGKNFSGGQRQRMEIARVLAADPTILILDEATSALDSKTEANVIGALRERGMTTIIIAHRLSTIRDCDRILVLKGGVVAESGTHEELMEKNGIYTSLVCVEE
jgi:NHLM bacteriocin system ABC transporter peptidase/ATP-binding protein